MVNDPASARLAARLAGEVFGAEHVIEHPPIAASEDFSYFLQNRPGAFVFVGSSNEAKGITAQHHSPRFDVDEDALPRGTELLVRLALEPAP